MPPTQSKPSPRHPRFTRFLRYLPAAVFAALSLIIYGDCLFDPTRLPASIHTDLEMQFLSWREFGFGEMSTGNLPLWSPHIFGGTPYMASFQSALFYPLNWLHLILPLGLAISWYVAIHSFLMGYFTSLWARYRGAGPAAQILAGCIVMFSGQYYLHAFAGHLPHLAVMVWVPLIFLSIDALADGRSWRWILLGGAALALQILAGHPQYVYYTGLTLGLYALLRMIYSPARLRIVTGLVAIAIIGAALAAIQLLPGLQAAGENVRIGGLSYEMASQFSGAPEQWPTLLMPYLFGNLGTISRSSGTVLWFYIGQGYLWELCFFVSVTGFLLAAAGLALTTRATRIAFGIPLVILVIVAMGNYGGLHQLLYSYLPGFSSFRAPAKLMFFGTLLIAMLAAEGFELLKHSDSGRAHKRLSIASATLAGIGLLLAIILAIGGTEGPWSWVMQLLTSRSNRLNRPVQEWVDTPAIGLGFATTSLLFLGLTAALVAVLVLLSRRRPVLLSALVTLAVIELTVFAAIGRATMPLHVSYPKEFAQTMASNPEAYRSLHLRGGMENAAMSLGTFDMWGYDPGLLRRYGQLIAASQGIEPDAASQYVRFNDQSRFDRLYRMFRLRWVFAMSPQPTGMLYEHPLKHAQLVSNYEVISDRDAMFARLLDPAFDPATLVFLETQPSFPSTPEPSQGSVKVNPIDSDKFAIEVTTDRPAILLVTDNYAQGWQATPLGTSTQTSYQILPANYCLRAIPLEKGQHHILMEYSPSSFIVGRWITAISAVAFIIALFFASRRKGKGEVACPAT